MKCLILAGGRGERLWPLSRINYPKQFIPMQKNHSLFQETVSRNLPFCDEFIIVTNARYRYIVENQMRAFQGTPYCCIYEEQSRGALNAITLAAMDMQPSEYVFVVVSDHVIYTRPESGGDEKDYKDSVMQAKEYAREGCLALFTLRETVMNSRYGYVMGLKADGGMDRFVEKPDAEAISRIDLRKEAVYRNLGMLLFRVDSFLNEMGKILPEDYRLLEETFAGRQTNTNNLLYSIEGSQTTYDLWETGADAESGSSYTYYSRESEERLHDLHTSSSFLVHCRQLKAVRGLFLWSQIDNLEDIPQTDFPGAGQVVMEDSFQSVVINNNERQTVVVNGLDNIMVTNTPDAVYIGRYGKSAQVRDIMERHPELYDQADRGTYFYRPWGSYEELVEETGYRIRRVFLPAGNRIPAHSHQERTENLTIVRGQAEISKDGETSLYGVRDYVDFPVGCQHEIRAVGKETLVFVETAVGDLLKTGGGRQSKINYQTSSHGEFEREPFVKLLPAYKDYLWGGTKLRDIYHMKCDYDVIAEAWMMSAHMAGQSIIASGRYKGLHFGDYMKGVGKEALGWKCSPLQNFPLLVKFIDARQNLSVQVHPNDDYALERENDYGKNEMWYVMDCEPGAGLYVGFNRDVTKEEVRARIQDNTIEEILNYYPTKPGDVYFIPAGTVHAICGGNLICEIQQSSNCTYRLYDYDRRDKFGRARELHVDKALDVLNFHRYVPDQLETGRDTSGTILSRCKYFETVLYRIKDKVEVTMDDSKFTSILCLEGRGRIRFLGQETDFSAGESLFVPAADGLLEAEGDMTIVLSHV